MVRKSPRKQSAATNSTPTVVKVGRRCRVCEGRPLKATCACFLNPDGTRRIKQRIRKPTGPAISDTPASLPVPTAAPPQTWSSPGPVHANTDSMLYHMNLPNLHQGHHSSIDPSLTLGNNRVQMEERDAIRSNSSPVLATPPPSSPVHPSSSLDGSADPFLNATMIAMPRFDTPLSKNTDAPLSDSDPDSDDDSGDSDFGAPPITPSRLKTTLPQQLSSPAYHAARRAWQAGSHERQRAPREEKPAQHGFVSGSMQGSVQLKIKRRKALRPVLMDGAQASRRFMREMKYLIDRVERVALETGSWVFIGGQQPQSRSNFVHFSSNAMRTHALVETQQLTNQFSSLISDLRQARLDSALTAQRTLRATQTAFESFQAEVKKTLEDKDRQTEYLVGMVQALQQQMGMPAQVRDSEGQIDLDQPLASGTHHV